MATRKKTPATANAAASKAPRRAVAVPAEATESIANAGKEVRHDLERAIPYLLARAGSRMGQSFSRELRQFELSLTDWRVCVALHHQPHQRLSDLALHTSTEPSTLSRVVDALLQRGLVVRDRSGEDARALALSLTPAGHELTLRIIPLAQLYERVSLGGLTHAQAESLRDMLRLLYDNLAALDRE
ncbi:MarR family transcriptional regulator [Acidovorax sp. NCPPB 3859]|nr:MULTISPECIES: MarR family transcriptional regulator [unclassified Acidovorax]MDA8451508.1 MarR family transcriptional regulator [Acidovorax sp. GBBC 3297]MDA8460953.1 MarR family transcriptional regulator [Acidovorax sp. GBBC 3333]MDA8465917.1 MarR family transcriptional regulator [Acidovorax sp. GBBC 3332]MDA8471023.1 MarR family transcriptional regulator [Acidovorax sp. GBBC 3299]WCM78095.1 MarR family transcriptional regulator [Acidovorax sp. GBBC 712]